jgi:hypothetical protein
VSQFLERYDVTVAADLLPGEFATSFGFVPGIVLGLKIEIPAGHAGKTGIQIWYEDQQLLPRTSGVWFKGNKINRRITLDDPFPGGIGWRAEAYNTGRRQHIFWVEFTLDEFTSALARLPPVLLLRRSGSEAAPV